MSTFTVAMTSWDASTLTSRGQSITPNVSGPDGNGSPGNATVVYLDSVTLAYRDSNVSRESLAYLYDTVPSLAQLANGTYAIDYSTSYSDGSAFGAGTYTRTFTFGNNPNLDPTKTYYILFPDNQYLMYTTTSQYSGGKRYTNLMQASTTMDLQFSAQFSY